MARKGTRSRAAVLQAIPENDVNVQVANEGDKAALDIIQLINSIEAQLEERIASITSAAEDAIISLRNDLKTRMVRLPKATREMPLKDFQEKYPEDFKTGALQEIRQRYAAMAEAAQQAIPATTAKGTKTGMKRAAEPVTVLRTVKTRRTASALMPSWGPSGPPVTAAPKSSTRAAATDPEDVAVPSVRSETAIENLQPVARAPGVFNGMPLQTPLPFAAGSAMPLPVTMLTQKRGGRTKAAAVPDAAVVTTADGMQWALSKDGVAGIPESHRAEVAEMLSAQFNFLAAALGKTVFDRTGGRGGRHG